jgi:hypothetical protein
VMKFPPTFIVSPVVPSITTFFALA